MRGLLGDALAWMCLLLPISIVVIAWVLPRALEWVFWVLRAAFNFLGA